MELNGEAAKMNKEWHLRNKFPKEGTEEEKNAWRMNHSENCGCGKRKN
jgi:hypothetical protein